MPWAELWATRMAMLLAMLLPLRANAAVFIPLGDLPGGDFFSDATGVSDDGRVVVGASNSVHSEFFDEAYRWTSDGGMVGLGTLPSGLRFSGAEAVSADGSVVVGSSSADSGGEFLQEVPVRWTDDAGLEVLEDLAGLDGAAAAVSADGTIIAGTSAYEAFVWSEADGITRLGTLFGPDSGESSAAGISADGRVVVGQSRGGGVEAYRWTAEDGIVGLGYLSERCCYSVATDVSADGSVVVGYSYSATTFEAFRWTAGTGMVGLGDYQGGEFDSEAHAVSGDGALVGGNGEIPKPDQADETTREAFIWTQSDGNRRLEDVLRDNGATGLDGWILNDIRDISTDGQWLVGNGTNPDGNGEAFLANLATTIDIDGDGALDGTDNCPLVPNADQADMDVDSKGDVCDDDADGDQISNTWESQYGLDDLDASDATLDLDGDTLTNVEEFFAATDPTSADTDGDGFSDSVDNCPADANAAQEDSDGDGSGDACDVDDDDDGWQDVIDAYPLNPDRHAPSSGLPPSALDDSANVTSGSSMSIDVLANDEDLHDTPLTVDIVTQPENGTASIVDENSVTYVPDAGFVGDDSFSYSVTDADGESSVASVFISVSAAASGTGGTNNPPSASDDKDVYGVSGLKPPPVIPASGGGAVSPLILLLLVLIAVPRRLYVQRQRSGSTAGNGNEPFAARRDQPPTGPASRPPPSEWLSCR